MYFQMHMFKLNSSSCFLTLKKIPQASIYLYQALTILKPVPANAVKSHSDRAPAGTVLFPPLTHTQEVRRQDDAVHREVI